MDHVTSWLERLGYSDSPNLVSSHDDFRSRPYAAEINDLLTPRHGAGVSQVYCVGDVPVICFADSYFRPRNEPFEDWANSLRRKIWNQGLATVVIIMDEHTLSAFSVLQKDEPPILLQHEEASALGPWSASEFTTSAIYRRLPDWFRPELRIDQQLLSNLSAVVDKVSGRHLPREAAEALLAQVVFVRYLESRGIIGDHYREKHSLKLIEELIRACDKSGIEKLLGRLADTFNGDFLNSHAGGILPWTDIDDSVLAQISRFLSGENIETGQTTFWGYDFGIIPVELLSSIYESFLVDRQKDQGAYYTPRHLATLTVEQAFRHIEQAHCSTVFDGACGSGILLTTAFQKMLSSAEYEANRHLTFSERVTLLTNNIFGADVDPTACWITAFSLYLCLLDRLSPADVALLQEDENTKLPPLVSESSNEGNILAGSAGDFFDTRKSRNEFDVLISNPPWREAKKGSVRLDKFVEKYFEGASVPDRQIAAAYAYGATRRVHEQGVIALILPLNLLLGLDSFAFRQRLLELMSIDRIINFADLRHLLFPNAKNSCALVLGRRRPVSDGPLFSNHEIIEYLTPKAHPRIAFGAIAVTQNDRVCVSPLEAYNNASIFIRRYWGRDEDLALLRRIERFGTLRSIAERRGWVCAKGFHKTDRNNPSYRLDSPDWRWLGDHRFLATRRIPKDDFLIGDDAQLPRLAEVIQEVATPGGSQGRLYDGPRVLWRNGLSRDLRVRAVFSERAFAFQHTACCIGGGSPDADLLRFLTLYLRSDLATYFINLTSFSAIADRQAVSKTEILDLPFIEPEFHPQPDVARQILSEVSDQFAAWSRIPEWQRPASFLRNVEWLNERVMTYFAIESHEALIVKQTAELISPSVQPTSYKALSNPLNGTPSELLIKTYLDILNSSLECWQKSRRGKGSIRAEVLAFDSQSTLGVVRLSVNGKDASAGDDFERASVARWLGHDVRSRTAAGALLEAPDLMLADGPSVYFVKPLQGRFWEARAALADTERLVAGINAAARHQ